VNLNHRNLQLRYSSPEELSKFCSFTFKKAFSNRLFSSRLCTSRVCAQTKINNLYRRTDSVSNTYFDSDFNKQIRPKQTVSLKDQKLVKRCSILTTKTSYKQANQLKNSESKPIKNQKKNLHKHHLSKVQNQDKIKKPRSVSVLQNQQIQSESVEVKKKETSQLLMPEQQPKPESGSKAEPTVQKKPQSMRKVKKKKLLSKTERFAFKAEHRAFTLLSMIKSYMYLGHPAKKWHPKMKPFVYPKSVLAVSNKKIIRMHIIDLVKSMYHAKFLSAWLTKIVMKNKKILFVGTEGPYAGLVSRAAKVCQAFYVNEKWLGGMLTNWKTIAILIDQLKDYERLTQSWQFQRMPKKEAARILKQKNKLQKYLGGIKYMASKPDFVIVIGQLKERKVLNECKKSKMPSLSIVDTNCNPTTSDLVMPSNDDSNRSLRWLFSLIVVAIKRGQLLRKAARAHLFKKLYTGPLPSIAKETFEKRKKQRKNQNEKQRTRESKVKQRD
jgi:small subunit ribosomal protein S2